MQIYKANLGVLNHRYGEFKNNRIRSLDIQGHVDFFTRLGLKIKTKSKEKDVKLTIIDFLKIETRSQ